MRCIYSAVALVDVLLHVPHVVVVEAMFAFVCCGFVFGLQGLGVDFGARTKVLFGVCEEVMWAGTDDVGSADFWIGDGELGMPGRCTGSHKLLCAM